MNDADVVLEFIQRRMPSPPESGVAAIAALARLVDELDAALEREYGASDALDSMRAERDEAIRLLHGVVEADRQDARMGHPNPGDSCIGIYISLTLMEWLDKNGEPNHLAGEWQDQAAKFAAKLEATEARVAQLQAALGLSKERAMLILRVARSAGVGLDEKNALSKIEHEAEHWLGIARAALADLTEAPDA